MAWLRNQEEIIKVDFGKHCISRWQISNNKMTSKIVGTDGTEQHRGRSENNQRVTEFGTQIENVENQNWTNVLGTKHNRKFVIHIFLRPEEGREEDIETNEETSDGISNNKSCTVTDTSILHNQMRGC